MPKLTERERLAELEARQQRIAEEIEGARRVVRGRYGLAVQDIAVEQLSERDFRDILTHAIRIGAAPALAALKALSPSASAALPPTKSPEGRPSDEHGGATRRRPMPQASHRDATDPA